MELRELTYFAVVIRITAAFVMGGILGFERGLKHRPAGLRTYMLVCVGACMIMMTNLYIYQVFQVGDPVRMGAQVVSGIGFLGAGTIVVTKQNQIKGLTTAAGLWSAAAVGLAIGIGFYEAAFLGSLLILLTLTVIHHWDEKLHRNSKTIEIYAELESTVSIGHFIRCVREYGGEIDDIQLDRNSSPDSEVRVIMATLKTKSRKNKDTLLSCLRKIDGVLYLEIL